MGAYITVQIVRHQYVTDLEDGDIAEIISEVEALIAYQFTLVGVPALVVRRAVRLQAAYEIMLRDPNAQRIGEYSEDRSTQLKLMKEEADKALDGLNIGATFKAVNEPI